MAATDVAAQGLSGQVVDARTSAPLPGVLVALLPAEGDERLAAVLSDSEGRFVLPAPGVGRYRALAERIGLATEITEPFEIPSADFVVRRVEMIDRAVRLEGLVVDARVRSCRPDPVDAPRIQRWWDEVRKALDVSSLVQEEGLARFRIQQFERHWSEDLRSVRDEQTRLQVGFASRPFVSIGADRLVADGFVQGEPGSRQFYAPDAEVLVDDRFLANHCFSLVEADEGEDRIGLRFEPARDHKTPDILGTLWVDTLTAQLDRLEYRYANLDWLPQNESGGEVRFRYLPSGAWIVSDWYVRMPQVGVRQEQRSGGSERATVVAGYVDVGGRVRQLSGAGSADGSTGSARLHGSVVDSISGGPLAGARVSVLGTRFSAVTDTRGEWAIEGVPAGEHALAFFHPRLTTWGLASPFREITVEDGASMELSLAVPRFRTAARTLCGASARDVQTILTGIVVDAAGDPVDGAQVHAYWEDPSMTGATATADFEMTTGSDGRYLVCGAPGEARVDLSVGVDGDWTEGGSVTLPTREIAYRELRAR